jgi:ATP-dependent Clp protease adaptor protein ClpS
MNQHHADGPAGFSGSRKHCRTQDQSHSLQLPRYKVILPSGAVKDMMFVVRTIMELTRLCLAEATHKMWEAYHCGRSLLLVTYQERAEFYVEQFAGKGLTVLLERA